MKYGKISQTVMKRSVLKQIDARRKESFLAPSVSEVCAGIHPEQGENIILTDISLYGNEKDLGVFAAAQAVNELAVRHAEPIGILVSILLTSYAYESRLKAIIQHIEETARTYGIEVMNVKVEVSPVVTSTILHMTAVGLQRTGLLQNEVNVCPGDDLILINQAALEGSLRILREKKEELEERFVPFVLDKLERKLGRMFAKDAIELAYEAGAKKMRQITSGGILAALWDFAEEVNLGCEIDLKNISIAQETIEICEYYHLNPYQMTSAGALLLAAEDGAELVRKLKRQGIEVQLLGKMTKEQAKIMRNGEEQRFLDRPAPDALIEIYVKEEEKLC